jgi:hypothetical protein
LSEARAPSNGGDSYGTRIRGTLKVPVSGEYRFYISSNNQGELWLGTTADRFSRRKVAFVSDYTDPLQWTKYAAQASGIVTLEAGQHYWIEALMKQGTGDAHLAVGWVRPGGTAVEVIPAALPDGTAVLYTPVLPPGDLDDDGLPDAWEATVGLNPGDNGRINGADGGYSDWDEDGFTNFEEWLTGGKPLEVGGNVGVVRRDVWTGISGSRVGSLTGHANFPKKANFSTWEQPAGLSFASRGDSYGQRLTGCVVPPHSGNWRFWIASDDASELWLSSDASRLNKDKVAFVFTYTNLNAFDTTPSQKSLLVPLVGGQPYYYEVLHKEGYGNDFASVAWAYEPSNWALSSLGSSASQSSTAYGGSASRAIDGNTSGVWSANSVTHTDNAPSSSNPQSSWWEVVFPGLRPVNRVVLWNRTDANTKSRLSNFRISVLDDAGAEVAGSNFFPPVTGNVDVSMTWNLPALVQARRIRISFNGLNNAGNGYLSLAEVQAYEWHPEANRQIIPASALRSQYSEPLDLDGDSLPDAWESKYGLSPTDNGSTLAANGEYGNPDGDPLSNYMEYRNNDSPLVLSGTAGQLTRETWNDLAGGTVNELVTSPSYLLPAAIRDFVTAWQTTARGDYYGQRLRGTLTPSVSGDYVFWIASDGESQLSLSTNDRKFQKRVIASVGDGTYQFRPDYTNPGEYDKFPTQRSAKIYLEAGTSYFIEVIHKESYLTDHVGVAWSVNGATRSELPFSALRSFTYDIDDLDDDDLPDSWESRYQLDPSDNGRYERGIEGALGDADYDQLTNREEYLLGTNPKKADTDGDLISDFVESKSLGSDPTDPTSGIGSQVAAQSGSEGSAVNGEGRWFAGPNGSLLSLDRRGIAGWTFNLTGEGYRLLEILATPQGNTWAGAPLTLGVSIVRISDSKRWSVGTYPIRDNEGQPTQVLALSPWLATGQYRVEIAIANLSESRNVRIDRLRLLETSGNWVQTRLAQENGLLTVDTSSPVSPVCLEGITRDVARTSLQVNGSPLVPSKAIDNRWYANLPLPSSGNAQPFSVRFEDGNIEQSHSVSWSATNIIAGGSITIRQNDSLRLTAYPGAVPDAGAVTITGAGTTINTTADAPVARSFPTVGTFNIQASHVPSGTTNSMTVTVIAASFGADLVVRSERWRDWTPTNLPEALPYEYDSALEIVDLPPVSGKRKLRVAAYTDKPVHVIARSQAQGSVAARGTVDPYLIGDMYDTGLVELYETLPDGTIFGRVAVIADRLPPGGYVQLELWAGGALFPDGTRVKNLYAANFAANGVAYVDVYYQSMAAISSFCHYTRLYTANGTLVSGY